MRRGAPLTPFLETFDRRVFSEPARFAFLIVAGIAVFLFVVLLGSVYLVTTDPRSLSPTLEVTLGLDGLLALGTLALAYAAGLQATVAREQADTAEAARVAQIRPSLRVQLERSPEPPSRDVDLHALTHSPFISDFPGWPAFKFSVRNLGPGNAIGVWVWVQTWSVEGARTWAGQTNLDLRVDEGIAYAIPVMDEALSPGQELPFEIPIFMERPPFGLPNPDLAYLAQQVVVRAVYADVEGGTQPPIRRGFRIRLVVPRQFQTAADRMTETSAPSGRGYSFLWERLTERDLDRIPPGRDPHDFY